MDIVINNRTYTDVRMVILKDTEGNDVVFKPVNLISFTIDGTQYYAEEGMTWGDWCTGEYDTHGFWCADKVYKDADTYIDGVTPYDAITDGGVYYIGRGN